MEFGVGMVVLDEAVLLPGNHQFWVGDRAGLW